MGLIACTPDGAPSTAQTSDPPSAPASKQAMDPVSAPATDPTTAASRAPGEGWAVPTSRTGPLPLENGLSIALQREGVFLDGRLIGAPLEAEPGKRRFDFDALLPVLRSARLAYAPKHPFLSVDPELPMGEFMELVRVANAAGIREFLLVRRASTGPVRTCLGVDTVPLPNDPAKLTPAFELVLHVTKDEFLVQRANGTELEGDLVRIDRGATGREALQALARKWAGEYGQRADRASWAVISVSPELPVQTFVDGYEDVFGPECSFHQFIAFHPDDRPDCWFRSVTICSAPSCYGLGQGENSLPGVGASKPAPRTGPVHPGAKED